MRKSAFFIATAAVIVIGGAWFAWHTFGGLQHQTMQAKTVLESKSWSDKQTVRTPVLRDDQLEALLAELAATPGKDPHFDFNANRFNPVQVDVAGNYLASQTELELDVSCDGREDTPDRTRSLESQLQDDYAINGQRPVPDDIFFESLTQFFKARDRYYQFSAFAKAGSRPPIYDIEFYSAEDAGMQTGLIREAIPVAINTQIDAPAVEGLLSSVLTHYRSQSMIQGARLMDVRVAGREGQQDHAIRYFNQQPVQWVFSSGLCQLTAQQKSSHCRCLPEKDVLKAGEY
jgi:hypothetical protein